MSEPMNKDTLSRRDFIDLAVRGAGGVALVMFGGGLSLVSANVVTGGNDKRGPLGYDPTRHQYVYLVDIAKCIGCGACVRACDRENQVPRHFFRTWIERYHVARNGNLHVDSPNGGHDGFRPLNLGEDVAKAFFVPKICNHCHNSPCVQLCPVGASFISPDGLVLVDEKRCIGCSYCVQACPYGSRFIHPETHTASKCTLCNHRLARGGTTACVQNCPTGARRLGDVNQVGDEVAEIIATSEVHILKPELHTRPQCYYAHLDGEVH